MAETTQEQPQVDWQHWARLDPTVEGMLATGAPMTREAYIDAKYGQPGTPDYPVEWTDEHEWDMPQPFQKE